MCSDFSLFYFFFYQNKGQARVTLAPPLDPPLLLVFVPYDFNCWTDFIGGTVSNSENGKLNLNLAPLMFLWSEEEVKDTTQQNKNKDNYIFLIVLYYGLNDTKI